MKLVQDMTFNELDATLDSIDLEGGYWHIAAQKDEQWRIQISQPAMREDCGVWTTFYKPAGEPIEAMRNAVTDLLSH